MIYEISWPAIVVFGLIVAFTLGLSFYLGARAKSAKGYFAAGGGIHWFVNGVAFAGDYLSAASFLGICGMIAFFGYDGFLYSIGYLAGWVVALFVIAEPLKRMGKYTFADALDSRFQSRGIKLTAAISTLVVSIFYLIPQMVGAGVLIKPLFGFPHYVGVLLVGAVVTVIVVTAGMVSTTYVQFLKGGLLVVFSTVLTILILQRGLTSSDPFEKSEHQTLTDQLEKLGSFEKTKKDFYADVESLGFKVVPPDGAWDGKPYVRIKNPEGTVLTWYEVPRPKPEKTENPDLAPGYLIIPAQSLIIPVKGKNEVNGRPQGRGEDEADLWPVGQVKSLASGEIETGPLSPLQFISELRQSSVVLWSKDEWKTSDGTITKVFYPRSVSGSDVLRPGNHPAFKGVRSEKLYDKLNFLSLMLALFGGTAALPHILIRYYTVKDQAAARKSTIVGIGSIGFFYVLTLFIGLGAMSSGALDVTDSNMAAPLLAKSFSPWLFAIISAIAFTTVLGTVSGLIIAAAGAIVHDLMSNYLQIEMNDHAKVRVAKIASVAVGGVAIVLGMVFEKMNVTYLVGWAFSIAASANLPSLVMLLFWRGTTKQGITAAISVGMISSLTWILLSADTYKDVYGYSAAEAAKATLVPFSQPGIVTIPLGFLVLVAVSWVTRSNATELKTENSA